MLEQRRNVRSYLLFICVFSFVASGVDIVVSLLCLFCMHCDLDCSHIGFSVNLHENVGLIVKYGNCR